MIRMGFAGFRHDHILALYRMAQQNTQVQIAGAWERSSEARTARAEEVSFTHQTYRQMLEDKNIDVIAVGDYYTARGQLVIDALKAGKHVIADKPLCTSLAELDEIEGLVQKTGLRISMMLDLRYNGNFIAAKAAIAKGDIGRVHNVYFGGQHPLLYGIRPAWYFEAEQYGGVINDIAIHGVDGIRYLTGLELDGVLAARCWNAYAAQQPVFLDSAQLMLRLSNGAGAIADVSYAMPDSIGYRMPCYWAFQVWGDAGMLAFSANSDGVMLYQNGQETGIRLPGIETTRDCLQDLLSDIAGQPGGLLTTQDVLCAMRQTLEVQAQAIME